MATKLTSQKHKKMIQEYVEERPHYKTFADALERILKNACKLSIPEVIVQARAKGVSSFAEKCVRKYEKYGDDPVHKMTDLCGARIIVHTLEQVQAVRQYIEANFKIIERDDKGLLLGETNFGYRDMHYLIKLNPENAISLGFTKNEISEIDQRIAEVQVRSVVQHAWADILHDRMYKAPLKLSSEAKRTGALLAAIMEDGDRSFNELALEIDGMVANYSAYASKEDVENKIEEQILILDSEQDDDKKPAIALSLARLQKTCGRHKEVVKLLKPFAKTDDAVADELLLELGDAICRVNRNKPDSTTYRKGQKYLETVIEHCKNPDLRFVPNTRKQKSLLARAYYKLAWSWEMVTDNQGKACLYYRKAIETEPANPYYLSSQLGFEIFSQRNDSMIHSMKSTIMQAIQICRDHAAASTELPYAFFTAGRLSLLLGQAYEAIGYYARALRYYYDEKSCVSPTVLDDEKEWVRNIHFGTTETISDHQWILQLFDLAKVFNIKGKAKDDKTQYKPQILVVAGGINAISKCLLDQSHDMLKKALPYFSGIVISGGTKVGIPGCIGKVASELAAENNKHFELIGYSPYDPPSSTAIDEVNYDENVKVEGDRDFSPNQIFRMWSDFADQGYKAKQVQLIGFCGGELTKVEYYIALAMGAEVNEVQVTDGSCELLAKDTIWQDVEQFNALPWDEASIQALLNVSGNQFEKEVLKNMAQAFHNKFVKNNAKRMPSNMKPWDILDETYITANLEQAQYAVEILKATGFTVSPSDNPKLIDFTSDKVTDEIKDKIKEMAELEHGRWNVERLRNGWRPGDYKDEDKKIHNCLVPWKQLPDDIKQYDIWSVQAFPEILAKAGLEISH